MVSYVVCGVVMVSSEAGIRCTSVGLSSTKLPLEFPPDTELLLVGMDGGGHHLLRYKGLVLCQRKSCRWICLSVTGCGVVGGVVLLSSEAVLCRVSDRVVWLSCGVPLV